MKLIVDLQYFPPVILFERLDNFSAVVFDRYENFQKMSFRNRCQIAGGEGVVNLSVPLAGGRDRKMLMRDVRISDGLPWQAQHWKTIVSCYSRSPWFEYYRDGLEGLYSRKEAFLWDWNMACWEWIGKAFKLSQATGQTEEYRRQYPTDEWVDWRGKWTPSNRAAEEEPVIRYQQVFEERIGFQPNLSILDLLFCAGKDALRYRQS